MILFAAFAAACRTRAAQRQQPPLHQAAE
jgi:hypothetical protein